MKVSPSHDDSGSIAISRRRMPLNTFNWAAGIDGRTIQLYERVYTQPAGDWGCEGAAHRSLALEAKYHAVIFTGTPTDATAHTLVPSQLEP